MCAYGLGELLGQHQLQWWCLKAIIFEAWHSCFFTDFHVLHLFETNLWTMAFFQTIRSRRFSWLILATWSVAPNPLYLLDIHTFWHGIILRRAPKRWDSFWRIIKKEMTRDRRGSRIYQSVNRRTMAIRITAATQGIFRKCRLRMDSFCFPLQTLDSPIHWYWQLWLQQRIPSSLTGCG